MDTQTTVFQDEQFATELYDRIESPILSALTESIKRDYSWVLSWVAERFSPDQIFDTDSLEEWAESNGYIKE